MSGHLIRIIATYEMRTLLRSWFFRIFAAGAVFGFTIFNIALNVESSGAPWIYRALPASIPYANLIILNLGQAIVAVFLASEFLKQDRKNDSVEVIYARSMTNAQYIFGKSLGILAVFLVLNLIVLSIGIGFSFLNSSTAHNLLAFLAYPLLISLPTLVFILGLSFFVMVLVKNQAVTFILLIGYIALTIFYLNQKAYHIFDYIAYQVPMMYSSITGFADLKEILMHRGIYLILGVGFILLTINRLNRLPQSPKFSSWPLYLGLVFLFSGSLMITSYLNVKKAAHSFRKQVIELNNRYLACPRVVVDSCRLNVIHRGSEISVEAVLNVTNRNHFPVDSLVFSLNPKLEIKQVTIENLNMSYKRESQLVILHPETPLAAGGSLKIDMKYIGGIDENIAFLDKGVEEFDANYNEEVFTMRKRYAFLEKNFVCLTSGSCWYPVSGTGYASISPMKYNPDFTYFFLKVQTSPHLTAVSQGRASATGNGVYEFQPDYPLPQLSLLIGDYIKKSVTVDSVEYSLFTIKGHDYFSSFFDKSADTIPFLIRQRRNEYEASLRLGFPFKRLILAEVPVHFSFDKHIYSYTSDAVQPEMILCPEKGIQFGASDFKARRYRLERERKRNNEEVLPEILQVEMFNQFVRDNFMARKGQDFYYYHSASWNTYSIFAQYVSFAMQVNSDQFPVLRLAVETYLNERGIEAASTLQWWEDLSLEEKINLELDTASLEKLLLSYSNAEEGDEDRVGINEIVQAKGLHLFNVLRTRLGEKEVDTLFTSLVNENLHRSVPFEEINANFKHRFSVDLAGEIQNWYSQNSLPGMVVGPILSYKVMEKETTKYQVRFQISNAEATDGIITLNVEINDPNKENNVRYGENFRVDFSNRIYLPAKSSFEAGYVFGTQPARISINTHLSKNLPCNILYNIPGFQDVRNVPLLDKVTRIPYIEKVAAGNEIIVDNEDPDFTLEQEGNQAYLRSKVVKNREDRYKYSAIRAWNPPREWKPALRSEFYGKYVRSACYTKGGAGERVASWKTPLTRKGSYDVFFYLDKVTMMWRRTNKTSDYNFLVYNDGGVEKINYSTENADEGWNYLGTFSITSDTARVELTNKSNGDIIFADAVKWVINE
ncbi:MAG: hypothetical protein U0T82_10890 [Bacteroidales bacterium]